MKHYRRLWARTRSICSIYCSFTLFLGNSGNSVYACGLVGYIGSAPCKERILKGLSYLEYRGYDSAGVCLFDTESQDLSIFKAMGKLGNLCSVLHESNANGSIGIGHTRWATHGPATDLNAHPHTDCTNSIAVAHNGIIENYQALKTTLLADGHQFRSDTDTEVVAHLFKALLDSQTAEKPIERIKAATQALTRYLEGSFALIIMMRDHPDILIAVRCHSPLTIGLSDEHTYIASDTIAYADTVTKALYMPNKSFALITRQQYDLYTFDGTPLNCDIHNLQYSPAAYTKGEHEHYMLKEINEQSQLIQQQVSYYQEQGIQLLRQLGLTPTSAAELSSFHLLGCGSSWHAGLIGTFFFESLARIPTHVHLASEFRYKEPFKENNTLYLAISQSGETADTLESVRLAQAYDLPVAVLTNVSTSSMVRETQGYMETMAGPEISVASTKAFTTSVVALYWLAHLVAKEKKLITTSDMQRAVYDLLEASHALTQGIVDNDELITRTIVPLCTRAPYMLCLGRHSSYPLALEGALKLKEITYISTHGGAAGELKHGTLALIDQHTPVIMLSHLDPILYTKTVSNAQEVKARNGILIVIAFEEQHELINTADYAIILPRTTPLLAPLAMCGVVQYLAYRLARHLGHDLDQPRNLAKSVTVE